MRIVVISVMLLSLSVHTPATNQARTVSSADAASAAGEVATVCGRVRAWGCSSDTGATDLFFEGSRGDAPFRVVISGPDRATFIPAFESRYRGREVCVTGRVETRGDRAVMTLSDPAMLAAKPGSERDLELVYSKCDQGVQFPKLLREVKPAYTSEAMKAKTQGSVMLQGVVGIDGKLRDLEKLSSVGNGLDQKAIIALREWRFAPGLFAGKPVAVLVIVEIAFTLKDP